MALHAFGPAVDVQAGGGDLRFPHHAYQAALAEAFTGVTPFSRARLNAGVVGVAGAKMAKSTGNLVLVSDLLKEHPAAAVRLLILDRRWEADWDFSVAGLDAAGRQARAPARGRRAAGTRRGRKRRPGGGRDASGTGQRPRRSRGAEYRRGRRRPGRPFPRLTARPVVARPVVRPQLVSPRRPAVPATGRAPTPRLPSRSPQSSRSTYVERRFSAAAAQPRSLAYLCLNNLIKLQFHLRFAIMFISTGRSRIKVIHPERWWRVPSTPASLALGRTRIPGWTRTSRWVRMRSTTTPSTRPCRGISTWPRSGLRPAR